jgi:hypothetical protein
MAATEQRGQWPPQNLLSKREPDHKKTLNEKRSGKKTVFDCF